MRGRVVLLCVLVSSCQRPSTSRPPTSEPDASTTPAPDGIPVTLEPTDELVASLAVDADDDGDRDLYVVLHSVASPYRLALLVREGDGYQAERRIDGGMLDEMSEAALDRASIELKAADGSKSDEGGLFQVTFRYEETCAPAEHEEAEVHVLFPVLRALHPALSYFARYQRIPCGRSEQQFLETCRPSPFVDRRISARVEEDGEVLRLEATRRVGDAQRSAGTFSFRRSAARYTQDPARAAEALAQVTAQAHAASSRSAEEALVAAEDALEVVDTVCPSASVEMPCHGTSLGMPGDLLAPCDARADRGALLLMAARALARMGKARAALIRLGQAREAGADRAQLDRGERELLAMLQPSTAKVVGIMSDAAPPTGESSAVRPPFVWESAESLLYSRGSEDIGRYILGQGDQGKLKGLEAREVRRTHSLELRSPSGALAIVSADSFGVFVCPASDETRVACQRSVRDARQEDDEASCRLVADRLTPELTRLTLGACTGAAEPVALGFVDEDRVAIVAGESADPVLVSIADPTHREPMPDGPSPLFVGSSFAADGSFRLVLTDLGLFRVEGGAGGRETRVLAPGFDPTSIALSPDGRHFAAMVRTGGARVFELR